VDLERLEALFLAACDLPDGERAAFLDAEVTGDPADEALRRKLESMLRVAGADDETLPRPRVAASGTEAGTGASTAELPELPELEAGAQVGRYRLLERLGEGGFGVVARVRRFIDDRQRRLADGRPG